MPTMRASLKHAVKSIAERGFGVAISRVPPFPANKHADEALRQMRAWSSRDVFFDVGANDGRTILRLDGQLGHPRTFAFEPVSSTYRTLLQRTAHLPNVRAFPLALGGSAGAQQIHLHAVDAMNSFAAGWAKDWTGTEEVQVATIDGVMREQGLECIHFLKIDTEGYEMEVLRGAECALRESRIAVIQVEVGVDQLEKPVVPLETVRRRLAPHGYLLQGVYNQCRVEAEPAPAWLDGGAAGFHFQALAYCDALFVASR